MMFRRIVAVTSLAALGLSSTSCFGSHGMRAMSLITAPETAGQVLVDEESKLVEICSAFEANVPSAGSSKVTDLLRREQQENLGAILDALRGGRAASEQPNTCRTGSIAQCTGDIRTMFDAARLAGGERARVAKGLEASLGDLSTLNEAQAQGLGAKIRFSVLAIDGYIRLANGFEREVDQFVQSLEIPVPLVSSLARALARSTSAEIVAAGTGSVVHVLEKHALVHRPAMIRQTCERYLGSTEISSVAAHGLRRIIMTAADAPSEFVDRRCAALQLEVKGPRTQRSYDACSVIAAASQAGNVPARKVITNVFGKLKSEGELAKAKLPAILPDLNPKQDVLQSARVVQTAALACANLMASSDADSVSCSLASFNALGSAAALDPPPPPGDVDALPDESQINKLVMRVEELVSAQSRTSGAIEELRRDLESYANLTDGRFDGLHRALTDFSHAQRDVAVAIGRCRDGQRRVLEARRNVFEMLGRGPRFDEVCSDTFGKRFVERELGAATPSQTDPAGKLLFQVAELCNEQRSVPLAVRFDGGLFVSGRATLNERARQRLSEAWGTISKVFAQTSAASAPFVIVGHVDPQGFASAEYGSSQVKLMNDRASAALDYLQETHGGAAQFKLGSGEVPPTGSCSGQARACAEWRTVSLENHALFPVLDVANCR